MGERLPSPLVAEVAVDPSDDTLMELAQRGQKEAFCQLVRRHQARCLRIASRYVGSQHAEEAVQESFQTIYQSLPRYRSEGKFTAFLHRVLVNRCRMMHRAARRERVRRQALATLGSAQGRDRTADESVLSRQRAEAVQLAVSHLSARHRDVVALRFAGELSHQEVADALGLSVGTVKSRLSRAFDRLRRTIGEGP